jgi:hypothetical protein
MQLMKLIEGSDYRHRKQNSPDNAPAFPVASRPERQCKQSAPNCKVKDVRQLVGSGKGGELHVVSRQRRKHPQANQPKHEQTPWQRQS